ncbi:MAG: hypothetical protein DMG40_20670 [Acidobacteria bacterium]|nr:MAG: hypothetical protein DMG40_20670 [Acidobacteriota bacterium]
MSLEPSGSILCFPARKLSPGMICRRVGSDLHLAWPQRPARTCADNSFPRLDWFFYSGFAGFLGFQPNSDEWKVMGLAPYGQPGIDWTSFIDAKAVPYRVHARQLATNGAAPYARMSLVLGPPRKAESEIEDRHKNIAYAVQDACEAAMSAKVNNAVKFREWWRPFAPSLKKEAAGEYLETAMDSPFMILTAQVRPEKRGVIPAVTHVDGSARPQTVEKDINPLYWRLIDAFEKRTGVPVVLNTSFNLRGEAIVHTPTDAIRTFFSSGMDALVIGSFLVEK